MGGDVWVVGRSTLVPALATHKLTSTNGHNNRLKAICIAAGGFTTSSAAQYTIISISTSWTLLES